MQLVLASSNKGKVREFNKLCSSVVTPFSELMDSFEIIEDGNTFAENALIKANTIYNILGKDSIVISDDSGITVPILGDKPSIYSARYAGENATDRENLLKLINDIKETKIERTPAYYTASIAIVSHLGKFVVHGWMYGSVITEIRGENGFGYDPIFIPEGSNKTLGELDDKYKSNISHRAKALKLAKPIIQILQREVH
ncbi:Nucleoside 5-triphosphatase RdgB (dHAPTP, dITP, XTP-specific) [hydrothermal vent metagenome]|uniref:dITP/XTP pyrophosphatase n=1 Tax=hydrothermal vent metagenome TaxID=652676 RepID=A0A1W1BHW2_9ZZZZ